VAREEKRTEMVEPWLLRTWKEIAWFLDCSEITARKMHYYHGMPVFWIERVATAIPAQLKIYLEEYNKRMMEMRKREKARKPDKSSIIRGTGRRFEIHEQKEVSREG
jgi:hypothetical protein